ncbi:MAG: BCCT family transporter, partial [Desulfobacterales bacterium]|nr:BCCT family transporter [Desulfobacterales bacterium]
MKEKSEHSINRSITFTSVICCAVFIIATLISPEGVKGGCDKLFKFFTGYFGWTYLTCVAGFVLFCFAVALGKYGNIRLG